MFLKAKIINTSDWKGHWFHGMEGRVLEVKKYPYKSTKGGLVDCCGCLECILAQAGKELYITYEVVKGYKHLGSIIPECCLEFIRPKVLYKIIPNISKYPIAFLENSFKYLNKDSEN